MSETMSFWMGVGLIVSVVLAFYLPWLFRRDW